MRLLITGTGRCGTTWIADALTNAGLPCAHEKTFNGHTRFLDRPFTAEAAWQAAPHTPMRDTYIVHLVRDPLATIRSRVSGQMFADHSTHRLAAYAVQHAPRISEGRTIIERTAIHWVEWNRLVSGADEIIRLEDITVADINRLARTVAPYAGHLTSLPPASNTRPSLVSLSWDDIRDTPGIQELADQYGYQPN